MDALPEARQADLGQYLLRNGDDGAAVLDRLDSGDLDTFLDQSPSTRAALTSVDSGDNGFDAARFIRNTDAEDRAVLDRLDGQTQTRLYLRYGDGDLDASNLRRIDELIESGDMDQADVQRLLGILETRDTDPLIGEDINVNTLIEVVESNGDLSDTRWVVQKSGDTPGLDNEVVWIENGVPGDDGTGWQHIDDKHTSDIVNQYDSIGTSRDVERLLNDAIRNPDRVFMTNDGKAVFVYEVEPGTRPVTVYVGSNGFTQTMYPQSVAL